MRYSFLLILFCFCLPVTADMYKWTDKDGKVIYSDKPNPNGDSKKVTGTPLTTYKSAPIVRRTFTNPANKQNTAKSETYSKFSITQPINDAAFRQNAGNVTATFEIKPRLATSRRDKIEVFVDGKKAGETAGLSYNLLGLDRGTHTLTAKVVNTKGKILKSHSVTFHLQRSAK